MKDPGDVPPGYSLPATAAWFLAGGAVTAVFSGSLAQIARNAGLAEVLTIGMIVPTFTWAVQLTASGLMLSARMRQLYWGDLGRVCLIGSVALLPAGFANLIDRHTSPGVSMANVFISVAIMAVDLFRRCSRHGIPRGWPASWCLTITLNMALFYWSSQHWWIQY